MNSFRVLYVRTWNLQFCVLQLAYETVRQGNLGKEYCKYLDNFWLEKSDVFPCVDNSSFWSDWQPPILTQINPESPSFPSPPQGKTEGSS